MKKMLFRNVMCIIFSFVIILSEANSVIATEGMAIEGIAEESNFQDSTEIDTLEESTEIPQLEEGLQQEEEEPEEVLSEDIEDMEKIEDTEIMEPVGNDQAVELSDETRESFFANALSVQLDRQYTGSITDSEPACVYKFALTQSGTLNINARSGNIGTLDYVLYDANGTKIVDERTSWNSSTGLNSANINWVLTSGIYYLAIGSGFNGYEDFNGDDVGSFNFKVSLNGSGESFKEGNGGSNNSITKANSISLGRTYTAQIAENDVVDYFKFTLTSPSEVTLFIPSATESVLYQFYGYNGEEITTDYKGSELEQGEKITYHLTKGTFYIKFSEDETLWRKFRTSIYKFILTAKIVKETFPDFNGGGNNTLMTANSILIGKSYDGQIADNDNVDYFKFTISTTQKIDLTVSSDETFQYKIYDYNGNEKWKDYDDSTTFTLELQKGIYYLGVHRYPRMYLDGKTGAYSFRLSVYEPDSAQISNLENTKKGIKISWNSVEDATGYKIYRRKGTGSYILIAMIGNGNVTSYTDKKVSNKKNYTYKMMTLENSYFSVYSTPKEIYCMKKTSAVKKLSKTSRGFSVNIKKVSKITGYEVQYSRYKDFSYASSKKTKKRSCKINVYRSSYYKYIYYVRVRCYKKVGKKTYYSPWSGKKKITI